MTRLLIPRTLTVIALVLAGLLLSAAIAGVVRDATRWHFLTLQLGLGLPLLAVGIRWAVYTVHLHADRVIARTWRGRSEWAWTDIRGLKLDQGEARPTLAVHTRDGTVTTLPAWSLRAVHEDGEVEPARAALERMCAEHDVAFKARSVLDPLPAKDIDRR